MSIIYQPIEQEKAEIRGQKAKKAGFIVAHTGELYIQSLGRNSAVYIERNGSLWATWGKSHLVWKK